MMLIASIPLWIVGGLLFSTAMFGIVAVALNEKDSPRFKGGDDGEVILISLMMMLASAIPLYVAAKVMTP